MVPKDPTAVTHTVGEEGGHAEGVELYMGISLVTGFVFMLMIDQLSPSHSHSDSGIIHTYTINLIYI